jgi:RHS repeat-associated protein
MTYGAFNETRTYDPQMMQLTHITTKNGSPTVMDMSYGYTAGHNNGRITQSIDGVLNETVNYTYDSLNHLATAQAINNSWGNAYSYDGFGNLTGATVTAGSAPYLSMSIDPATNRIAGGQYDANGNPTGPGSGNLNVSGYDVENRLVSEPSNVGGGGGYTLMGYDPSGKRVSEVDIFNSVVQNERIYFYAITGQRLGTYTLSPDGTTFLESSLNLYFGGKLVYSAGANVATDRLGSVRANSAGERMAYWPYGGERLGTNGVTTPDGREKFGTYFRDYNNISGGMDYADQRYYSFNWGRFQTPDPGGLKTADPGNPTSWNRYSYANGDPVNFYDPKGRFVCNPEDPNCDPGRDPLEDVTCGSSGSPPPLPPEPPHLTYLSCTISLEDRPVDVNGRGILSVLKYANHDDLDVSITQSSSDGSSYSYSEVIEGLAEFQNPQRPPILWGNLTSNIFPVGADGSVLGDPKDHPATDQVVGKVTGGFSVCTKGAQLEVRAANFGTYKYNPIPGLFPYNGTNSNFYAWTLLSSVGLSLGIPPLSPGFPGSFGPFPELK